MVLICQWCDEEITSDLQFQAPLKSVMRLHTALYRKFLQITVTGLSSYALMITSAQLTATNTDLPIIKSLNASRGQSQVKLFFFLEQNVLKEFTSAFINLIKFNRSLKMV